VISFFRVPLAVHSHRYFSGPRSTPQFPKLKDEPVLWRRCVISPPLPILQRTSFCLQVLLSPSNLTFATVLFPNSTPNPFDPRILTPPPPVLHPPVSHLPIGVKLPKLLPSSLPSTFAAGVFTSPVLCSPKTRPALFSNPLIDFLDSVRTPPTLHEFELSPGCDFSRLVPGRPSRSLSSPRLPGLTFYKAFYFGKVLPLALTGSSMFFATLFP